MKQILIFLILNVLLHSLSFSQNQLNDTLFSNTDKENMTTQEYEKKYKDDINQIIVTLAETKTNITSLEKRFEEQAQYFDMVLKTTIWIVGIIIIVLSGAFSIFIWLFRRPDMVWKSLKESELEAKELLKNIKARNEYQKILFFQRSSGAFTTEDWRSILKHAEFAKKIESEKRIAEDWAFIGLANLKKKRYQAAIDAFERAEDLDDKFEIVINNKGVAYDILGDTNNAIRCYKRLLELNPHNDRAYNNLGVVYLFKKQYDKADEHFLKAIEINPHIGIRYANLFESNLLSGKDFNNDLLKEFKKKFKNDMVVRPMFDMLVVLKKVYNEEVKNPEEVHNLLTEWKNIYTPQIVNIIHRFEGIHNWVSEQPDGVVKDNLSIAMDFFDELEHHG